MIDVMLLVLFMIGLGGILVCVGVFLIPIGGAPAAMSTATGVATGCEMITMGAGVTGLFLAAAFYTKSLMFVIITAGVSSALMLAITMLFTNLIVIFGKGVPPAFATKERDPITGDPIKPYVTPGTVGHGVPTAPYLGGVLGSFLAGAGGALAFTAMYRFSSGATLAEFVGVLPQPAPQVAAMALSVITAVGLYLINANIAAYSIRGVIESWLDPKFSKLPRVIAACFSASILFGVLILLVSIGGVG
ncbi:tetrahydromethanopterin S-methyltransferase subunit D [Candidatus Hecatella orcuttiae]|jgi:tetrahydromethanopterin S-methyltransferase subunit D|uniref:tetrahydromethanopterin S-methyltransferase subunit D n=1 Tax=Candidatus Hecatella orcuttiae TaxID=1935119 RepID=UPI002867CA4F|nr:tetrahydromethanopterin S-methyltransferase subunit D [Candidatus Hecatella orcuttiae]